MVGTFKQVLAWGVAIWMVGASTHAEEKYPTRPVRIISSTPAGGPQDALARVVAQYLSSRLGQPFIVENRPGANTMIAAQMAAGAPPDGYTLMMATDSTLSINPFMYSKIAYRVEDFEPITQMTHSGSHLFINATVPAKTLKEFVEYAKARPGLLNYGSYGNGSNPHLNAEHVKQVLGIDLVHIPYKGSADSMAAFAANEFQMMIVSIGSARSLLQTEKVIAIATSGKVRPEALADVPTFQESGYPEQSFGSWFGIVAPKGTPKAIIDLLSGHIRLLVHSDSFKNTIATRYDWEAIGSTPKEFAAFLKSDRAAYRRVIKENNVSPIN